MGDAVTVLAVAGRRESLRRLVRAGADRRGLLLGATVVLVLANVTLLAVPTVIGRMVDALRAGAQGIVVLALTGVLGMLALVAGLLLAAGLTLLGRFVEVLCAGMRQDAFVGVLGVPLPRLESAGTGDVLTRMTEDVRLVAEALRTAAPFVLDAALSVLITTAFFLALDYRLALAVVAALLVHVWAVRWYLPRSEPVYQGQRESYSRHQERTLSISSELRMITRFGLAAPYAGRYRRYSAEVARRHHEAVRLQTRFFGRINLAEPVALLIVLAVGAALFAAGALTAGELTAAALYVLALFGPFNQLLFHVDTAQSALTGLRRVVGLVDHPPSSTPVGPAPSTTAVSLVGVGYSYPGRARAIADLTVDFAADTLTLVVGRSGSGKSTIAKLIAGLLEPDEGEIRVAVEAQEPRTGADRIVVLTQEAVAFSGTLGWNLRLSGTEVDDDRLRAALAEVGAGRWFAELDAGLDTEIGRTGHPLGTAALQQVALARLLVGTAGIVVLDEPTSALSSADAVALDSVFRRLARDRTVILVAHRLSLAPHADQILLVDRGRLVERGTHAQLLRAGGAYGELWSAWSSGQGL